jgi:hypothetical protein
MWRLATIRSSKSGAAELRLVILLNWEYGKRVEYEKWWVGSQ